MTEFTPGPWNVGKDPADRTRIYGQIGRLAITKGGELNRDIANANLIAAAPDMYEVLAEILEYDGGADSALQDKYVMERAWDALAKARGEKPND